jgi:hypothetical protein
MYRDAKRFPGHTANIVKQGGLYRLLMLVDGRWLDTGITSPKLLEITQIADREFEVVRITPPDDGSGGPEGTRLAS